MLKVNKNIFVVLDIELSQKVFTTVFSTGKDNHSTFPWDCSAIRLEGPQVVSQQTPCSKQSQLQDDAGWLRNLPSLENVHKWRLLSLKGQFVPLVNFPLSSPYFQPKDIVILHSTFFLFLFFF